MKDCIRILEKLQTDFSYYEFFELLRKIDEMLVNGYCHNLSSDFIFKLNNIMNFYVDKYVQDGLHVTFGDMLLDNILSSKEKITPTLLLYFYLDKKNSLGLEKYCNSVVFLNEGAFMCISTFSDNFYVLGIDWYSYESLNLKIEEFNYTLLHSVLHEIVHVYQKTRLETSDNLLDKLVFYDRKKDDIIIDRILGGSNDVGWEIHDALITEYMANEMADIYMLKLPKRSRYFSSNLLKKKWILYRQKKSTLFYMDPRNTFINFLKSIKKEYEQSGDMVFMQSILEEIDSIEKLSLTIIEQLKKQGISERFYDNYFNIFLNEFYRFNGHDIDIEKEKVKSL